MSLVTLARYLNLLCNSRTSGKNKPERGEIEEHCMYLISLVEFENFLQFLTTLMTGEAEIYESVKVDGTGTTLIFLRSRREKAPSLMIRHPASTLNRTNPPWKYLKLVIFPG